MNFMLDDAISGVSALDKWIGKNGFAGYDPYDVKGLPCSITLTKLGNKYKPVSLFRELIFEIFYAFPLISRRLLKIQPAINAKAMGLFATSYLDLYLKFMDDTFREKARQCMNWLDENKVILSSGIGWGYPFDWQSKELIPAGTPNGIVTTAVGDAFWKHYRIFHDRESLDHCIRICQFLMTLPVDQIDRDRICFSYTPLFINHVHNLNLFVAEFLIKTGMETGHNLWVDMGLRAVNYTVSDQLTNGAFDYNGPPEKPNHHYDNYHTGFVLRMLHSIWKITGREDVRKALHTCYSHYTGNFFEEGKIPKLMPDRKYRIDIHSCAESIHCLSVLSDTFPEGLPLAGKVLGWTLDHLQDKTGFFYYGMLKSRLTGIPYISKIPYIRWGQAWMLRAMTSYLASLKPSIG